MGIDEDNHVLPTATLEHFDATIAKARKLLASLDTLAASQGNDEALDRELAELWLRRQIHDLSLVTSGGQRAVTQMPRAADEIGESIFMTFVKDPRADEIRLGEIMSRIEDIPRYLSETATLISSPLSRWRSMELEKIDGLSELFSTVVSWAASIKSPNAPRLETAVATALKSFADYKEELNSKSTTANFHLGEKEASKLVRLRGIPYSLLELKAIADEFLTSTQAQIETLRKELCSKYGLSPNTSAPDLQLFLNKKFKVVADDMDGVVERYKSEHERLLEFLGSRELFPIPENQEMIIMRTPKFLEPSIPAGAMVAPESFRNENCLSLVYLTLSEALLDEHTELSIPNMMIHEGIPGHHLQLTHAALHKSLVRKHISANDQAEGWTTMLEDYVLDQGYLGELTSEARFCAKRDISRIGARVAIDLFFMTGNDAYLQVGGIGVLDSDDPFEKAGHLLQTVTGFVPGRVQAELNWYSQERGYPLCYLAGNRAVWQLKRSVAAHAKLSGFELDRVFHRTFLEAGAMPMQFLFKHFANEGLVDISALADS